MKYLKVLNILLIIFCIVLVINLITPIDNTLNKAFSELGVGETYDNTDLTEISDPSHTECYFKNEGKMNEVPIEMCCYQIQNLLGCESTDSEGRNFECYNSLESKYSYMVNYKTLEFCEKEGYNVKIR